MKHIHSESLNLIEGHLFAFDTFDWLNLNQMVPVIGMEGTVTCAHLHAHLHYTWDIL